MVKRPKTPEPSDDEPRFLTIYWPYPAHANLELDDDRQALARWLGCIVPPHQLIALHHKSSARNMVILEVIRDGPDFRRILGAHYWKKFLCKPSPEDERTITKIYFCLYSSAREVQKYGWKRVYIDDKWFLPEDFRPRNKYIAYNQDEWEDRIIREGIVRVPYPLSGYCDLPNEDPTNRGLCRPLPVEHFPRPKPKQQTTPVAVVGSNEWAGNKAALAGDWAKGTPAVVDRPKPSVAATSVAPSVKENRGRTLNKTLPSAPPGLPALAPSSPIEVVEDVDDGTDSDEVDQLATRTTTSLRMEDGFSWADDVADESQLIPSSNLANVKEEPVEQPEGSLWDDPIDEKQEELICTVHSRVCSKGICSTYAKQLKERDRQKKKADGQQQGKPASRPWGGSGARSERGRNGPRGRGLRGIRGAMRGKNFAAKVINLDNGGGGVGEEPGGDNDEAPAEPAGAGGWEGVSNGPW